ncbi:MAG: APC family permease [Armatimonadota bacterium]
MKEAFRKKIGLFTLVVVVFSIVAGGPYGLEQAVSTTGPGLVILLLLLIPLLWSLPISFITAEISSAFPQKGGYITWIKHSCGSFWSFQVGWLSWIRNIVDTALYPVLFADYLMYFMPDMTSKQRILICIAIVAVFTVLNMLGIKAVGFGALTMTIITLVPFIVLIIMAFLKAKTLLPFTPFIIPGKELAGCLGIGVFIIMWNYNGWEDFSPCMPEVVNPAKNFPRAILINIPLIALIYTVTVYACLCATSSWQSWTSGYFPLIAKSIGGPGLGLIILVAILFGIVNQISTILLYTSRIPYSLAFHRFLPKFFAFRIRKNRVPWLSLLICSGMVCVFCIFPFAGLIEIDIFLYAVMLLFEVITFLKLRVTHPDKERLVKVPGGWTGAIIASILPFTVLGVGLYKYNFKYLHLFLSIFLIGILIWFTVSKNILKSKTVKANTV